MSDHLERPPIAQAPLSLVLAVHNAEAAIEACLRGWAAQFKGLDRETEILVADEGSTDRTTDLAEALGSALGPLRVLRNPEHRGLGAAFRTGIANARHPLVLTTTADETYRPEDVKALLDVIDQVDLVAGCRTGAARPKLGWSERVYRGLIRVGFGVRLKDPDCVLKLYRRSIFARIPIQSDGAFCQAEIIAKANFLGCLMSEVPLPERPPASTETRFARSSLRDRLREASRVFHRPDFGPAVLPREAEPATNPSEMARP
jgi:glycosyltransferase involved in cell wall biosynthesis